MKETKPYEKPEVTTIASDHIITILGPSISCTGFGGSAADLPIPE